MRAAFALTLSLALMFLLVAAVEQEPEKWRIRGQLTEACTCGVPCTCNFGEPPSPHEFCHSMWSYWIQQGRFEQVDLRDLRAGGVEGPGGTLALLDVRADPEQRKALEEITQALTGRLMCMVRLWPLKASPADASGQGSVLHSSYRDPKFLGFEYLPIEQEITDRGVRLQLGDRGGFEASYLFGRDPSRPVTVENIVSWPIPVSIKGKTTRFQYKDRYNELDYKGTNSNQGAFDLSSLNPGARPMNPPE